MPFIRINEQEASSFAPFNNAENVVLIPLLYARSYSEDSIVWDEENPGRVKSCEYNVNDVPAKKYDSYGDFRKDFINNRLFVNNEEDKSFTVAYQLLLQGLTVVIKPILFDNAKYDLWRQNSSGEYEIVTERSITLDDAYEILESAINEIRSDDGKIVHPSRLEEFKDKNIFNLKFITTGGYANKGSLPGLNRTLTSYQMLESIASSRGDAIALVEFRPIFNDVEDLFNEIKQGDSTSMYSAAFFPWCECYVTTSSDPVEMPASYCYLSALANSIQSNANWFAVAGVSRGKIPGLKKPLFEVGEALMHTLQQDEYSSTSLNSTINPIYNAGVYGYRIWGNKVLGSINISDSYRNFLNVRMLLCDIKKQIYHSAMRVTFEPNDDIVWINFKTLTNSLLERMKSGRGISWYKWTREEAENKAQIKATLSIRPIEAVESFDINVFLTDEDVEVEETNENIY